MDIKISELTKLINRYDRANAGCSYGNSTNNMNNLYDCLTEEQRVDLSIQAYDFCMKNMKEAKEELIKLGIEMNDKYPYDYRLKRNE